MTTEENLKKEIERLQKKIRNPKYFRFFQEMINTKNLLQAELKGIQEAEKKYKQQETKDDALWCKEIQAQVEFREKELEKQTAEKVQKLKDKFPHAVWDKKDKLIQPHKIIDTIFHQASQEQEKT